MADLLERIRVEINARLSELRPLVDEDRRLDAALQALGERTSTAPAAPSAGSREAARSRAGVTTAAKPRKRAPRGANREAVLRAVADRPGATSAELAAVSGVGRNTLNGLLARLVKTGELQTRRLPTGGRATRLATRSQRRQQAPHSASARALTTSDASPADSAAE